MSKFLRTVQKIDGANQKVILQINSCTNCPLMKFHIDDCLATCRMFSDKQTNVVDDFVLNYNANTGQIYDPIPIPKWCLLPDDKDQLDFESKTYIVHEEKIMTSDAISDRDLPVVVASGVDGELVFRKKDDDVNVQDMLPALVAASVFAPNTNDLTPDEAYEVAYSEYENYQDQYSGFNSSKNDIDKISKHNKHEICSLCGEEDESVSRNTNHGMCDSCWEVSYNNASRKKQAFINNFRMKRGESFKSPKYNISVLKSKKHEILITV